MAEARNSLAQRLAGAALPLALAGAFALAIPVDPRARGAGGVALALAGAALALSSALKWRNAVAARDARARASAETTIAAARPGSVVLEGIVANAPERLVAPLSRDPCLWFDVRMERLGRLAGGWGWHEIARETRALPFTISDATGTIVVHAPPGARLDALHRFESVNPAHERVREWRTRQARDLAPDLSDASLANQGLDLRFIETRLKSGDAILASGTLVDTGGERALRLESALPASATAGLRAREPDARRDATAAPRALDGLAAAAGVALLVLGIAAALGATPEATVARALSALAP